MARLRRECPWDARQTHRSLVPHLVEEACETVEAIELLTADGSDRSTPASGPAAASAALREELGDLLLQIVFHAQIASESADGFDLDAVAAGIADKLVERHPYVFGEAATPDDVVGSWERRKAAEKGRRSSLDGIPERLSALSRATAVVRRARSHGVAVDLPDDPLEPHQLGEQMVALVARAEAQGFDAEQAAREAVRALERRVSEAESTAEG